MVFIETPFFTEDIRQLMSDSLYAELQSHLAEHPDAGDVIEGAGGIRKIRWKLPATGKRGGVRVIYYWRRSADQILMLLVYKKTQQDDLSPAQKRVLRQVVEHWSAE